MSPFSQEGLTKFNEFVNFTGLSSLTTNAFYGATLSELTLPPTLETFGNSCFRNMPNLTELIIPASVTSIGDRCFQASSNLNKITCLAVTPPTIGVNGNFYDTRCYWYVHADSLAAYKSANVWSDHADNILAIPE